MLINFISNQARGLRSGGFSALSAATCDAIASANQVNYAGPINPPAILRQKVVSKVFRLSRLPGDFFFYSRTRLEVVARQVEAACDPAAELDFFHGFTPWIAASPARPYVALSDCSFRDYIDHYHRRSDFRRNDLERIEAREAAWLRGAAAVAFTSHWAAERTTRDYSLDPGRVNVTGIFGEVDWPDEDAFGGGQQFAFVSTDFAAKGGANVLAAFLRVRARHPKASLVIVGDAPSDLKCAEGIDVTGFLHKEDPQDRLRLREILASSRALVHPSRSDISPHILVEAGYFGCPAISSRRFAIGEIIEDNLTGLLLDDPGEVAAIASAMSWMLEADESRYVAMRRAAWSRTRERLSRAGFEAAIKGIVDAARRNRR